MKLNEMLDSVSVLKTSGALDVPVEGITCDSRLVRSGWLFVAVAGGHVDGADYITQAISAGARVVASENDLNLGSGTTHLQVPDARRALAELSCAFHGHLSRGMTVVGVTGTNGKTTTTFMIRDILRDGGLLPGLLGTVAYEIGTRSIPASRTTPEAPDIHTMFRQMREAGCDSAVMEVSSHALALDRVHGIDFNIAVFTNLTQDHLDFHNDMETYFNVKTKLFQMLEKKPERAAVINIDDPWGRRMLEESRLDAPLLTYGFNELAMVYASDASVDSNGTRFKVSTPWGDARVSLQLLGRFNIHNALAALAVGGLCGVDLKRMVRSLESIETVPGRLELVQNRKGRKVFVDYAHTDDALKNVLGTLREICKGRLIVVFGCGGNRDRGKRIKMGQVAAALADYSIVTSDNPRNEEPGAIASDIIEGFASQEQYEVVLDRRAAIEKGLRMAGRKDILLVAGKGHETYQESKGTVVPFDDRETVRELI